MEYFVENIQIRLLRKNRDFSYVDKIGLLTNDFIEQIPGTELSRNGQYGVLIARNFNLSFETHISKNDITIVIIPNRSIDDDSFQPLLDSMSDLVGNILSILKKHECLVTSTFKSIVSVLTGNIVDINPEYYRDFLSQKCRVSGFNSNPEKVKLYSTVWSEGKLEYHIQLSDNYELSKQIVIFGYQEFELSPTVNNINHLLNDSIAYFKENIFSHIIDSCEGD